MKPIQIIKKVVSDIDGVFPKNSWGETSLFYNPGQLLPNGVYFCTIKEDDGQNDQSSALHRKDIFRLSIGVSKETYIELFGPRPSRPNKGGIVNTGHDFTMTNILMPHPIYAWMSWVCILNPSESTFDDLFPLITEAHGNAKVKFDKKTM